MGFERSGIVQNEKGLYSQRIGVYVIVEEKSDFIAVYDEYGKFITHRRSWNGAVRVVELLNGAYEAGRGSRMSDREMYDLA